MRDDDVRWRSPMLDPRRHELLNRRWRDTNEALNALESGTLWHPLSNRTMALPSARDAG